MAQGWRGSRSMSRDWSPLSLFLPLKTSGRLYSPVALVADRSKRRYCMQYSKDTECSCLFWQVGCGYVADKMAQRQVGKCHSHNTGQVPAQYWSLVTANSTRDGCRAKKLSGFHFYKRFQMGQWGLWSYGVWDAINLSQKFITPCMDPRVQMHGSLNSATWMVCALTP